MNNNEKNWNNPFSVSLLPNILTFGNVAVGIIAIIFAANDLCTQAGLLIITGAIFDRLDGKVARKYNVANELGKQLDSLADIITFGIAPAITIYMLSFDQFVILGTVLAVIFVTCGVYRLARFNILNNSSVFIGVPITAAGFLLAIFALYQTKFFVHPFITAIGMLVLSYSMVCNRPFKKI